MDQVAGRTASSFGDPSVMPAFGTQEALDTDLPVVCRHSLLGTTSKSRGPFSLDDDYKGAVKIGPKPGSGRKGATAAVRLEAVAGDSGNALLRFVGQGLDRRVRGVPPLQIRDLSLPETGRYRIVVSNISTHSPRYRGPYGVELSTSDNSWRTLKAGPSVEP